MAHRYFGINRGQTRTDIVEGASTNSTDIEVNVDLSKGIIKSELLAKLEEIADYILANATNPNS